MAKAVSYGRQPTVVQDMIQAATIGNMELIRLYENSLRAQKASRLTIRDRTRVLRVVARHIAPTTLALAELADLLDWQTTIGHLSTNTVATYTQHVKSFYGWTVKPMRLLTVSPAEDLPSPRVPRSKPRPIPEVDFQIALASCLDEPVRTWLLLARYAGLRCCEIAVLSRDDVLGEPPARLHVHGKGAHQRIVFIPGELFDELRPWMRRQGPLFTTDRGHSYTARRVSEMIAEHFAGLDMPFTAHQLRHLYGTSAYQLTKDARLVQTQMGHLSLETTQGYVGIDDDSGAALAQKLGERMRKGRRT